MPRVSALQLGLIVAGVLLVIGVIIYNAWQERRVKRRIAEAFRKDDTMDIGVARPVERLEPTLGHAAGAVSSARVPAALRAQIPPPSEAFNVPMADIRRGEAIVTTASLPDEATAEPLAGEVVDEEVEVAQTPRAPAGEPRGGTSRPDPDIECIAVLQATRPIGAGALAAGLHARLGKPLRWFGRAGPGDSWHLLAPDTQGQFREVAACLLLADRNGPLSRGQLEAFGRVLNDLAPTLAAAFTLPAIDEEVARGEALDRLCADVDVQIGLTLLKPEQGTIAGTRLRGVAEAAGFKLSPAGRFELANEDTGAVMYTLQNLRSEPFTIESLRTTTTAGVVLLLDVPRIADPLRVFDQMKLVARRLALTLGVEVVDDNRRPLDDPALARIREQVDEAITALRDVNIEPGSARALALFNA